MSITINHTPEEVDFIKNPIAFEIEGDNYIESSGSKANIGIEWGTGDSNGDDFILSLLDLDFTFECATTPDDSGLQYPPKGAETLSEWIESLIPYFQKNYYINKYYNLEFDTFTVITFESKNVGSAYDIGFTAGSSNATEDTNVSGVDPAYSDNYKFIATPYIELEYDSDDFTRLPDMMFSPDDDGHASVYIGKILKSLFDETNLPVFDLNSMVINYETLKRFYFIFAEYYGTTPTAKLLYQSDTFHAINGALHFDKWPGHDFFGDLPTNKKFLSNRSTTRETWQYAQNYLHFLFYFSGTANVNLRANVYRSITGNTPQLYLWDTIVGVGHKDVITVPVWSSLQWPHLSVNCYKYEVWLTYNDPETLEEIVLSETITYNVIDKPLFAREFIYKNDFGVFETLLAEKVQINYKTEKKYYEKSLSYDYQLPDGEILSEIEKSYNLFKVRTGYQRKTDLETLKEMFANNDVYLVGSQQFIPVDIEPGSFKLSDENNDLFYLEFKYRYKINAHLSE